LQHQVALVIDDVIDDLARMDRYAALGIPLTFAILPQNDSSRVLAEKAHQLGLAVILHLPMEPLALAHHDPGPDALYLKMSPDQLRHQFEKAVARVPHIEGINNHMGSAFTADASKMRLVMHWVKERHLFFLDSRTNEKSLAPQAARECGVPCLINETFLDNVDDVQTIEQQLDRVIALAKRNKRTVAIGHYPRKHLVKALANKIPKFRAHGVRWVALPTFAGARASPRE
jgi:uncharacterized protein